MTTREDVPPEIVREFDHHEDLSGDEDPFECFERLRGPRLVWSPLHGGFWITTNAEDYRSFLHQPDTFSTHVSVIPAAVNSPKMIPMNVDPPLQTKYRKILNQLFSPKAVAEFEGVARSTCREAIDEFIADGHCEAIEQFCRHLPASIYLSFMGLSRDSEHYWASMRQSTTEIGGQMGARISELLRGMIEERAATPEEGDDYPRRLLRSELDGRRLTKEEVLNICWNLWVAAFDTTSSALAQFLFFLARHDEERRRLSRDLSLVPSALEELLRTHSFVISNRTATRDIDVNGLHIKKGDQVMLPTTLASRDPAEFDCPAEFRLDRFPNRHLAFGAGPHRCLGLHLARMELRVGLEEWHERIPEYRVVEGTQVPRHGGHLFGIDRLELELDRASARSTSA